MALSYFKYPDRLYFKNKYGTKIYGGLRWRDSGKYLIKNPNGYSFSLPVNATSGSDPMEEITIFEYSNGCVLKLAYRLFIIPSMNYDTYRLSTMVNLYSKGGALLSSTGGFGGDKNYFPQSPRIPYSEGMFVPGQTMYSTNSTTVVDEEATRVSMGAFYILSHTALSPRPFAEESEYSPYVNEWNEMIWLPCDNDSVYASRIGMWVTGGDGTNPSGKDDGGGGGGGEDPAGSDDNSEPGGGDGDYDNDSDPIDFPPLPTGGAIASGAVKAYVVSPQTMNDVVADLWDTSIFNPVQMWQKSIADPINAIVSFHAIPILPQTSSPETIVIGNFNTGETADTLESEFVEVDCGTVNMSEYWGSALDYSPYTKVEIFLPFIGVKQLTPEDTMKATIHVKYYVDLLTGECVAFIKCGQSVLYHFTGECKLQIPLTGQSTDLLQNTMKSAGNLVSSLAVGAAVGGGIGMAAGAIISNAANVASTKINTNRTGDLGGARGIMDDFVPYMIIHRPVQSLAKDYNKFKGYTSNITSYLGVLSGYTEVEHIHLEGIPDATDAEMKEIESLLKSGVLL